MAGVKSPPTCPTCHSPDPRRHPAMQFEGEVQPCPDPWHGEHAGEGLDVPYWATRAHRAEHHVIECGGRVRELQARLDRADAERGVAGLAIAGLGLLFVAAATWGWRRG